jgi:hypothetical protein
MKRDTKSIRVLDTQVQANHTSHDTVGGRDRHTSLVASVEYMETLQSHKPYPASKEQDCPRTDRRPQFSSGCTTILCGVRTILASAGVAYVIPASTPHDRCNAHPLEITQGPGGNPCTKGVGNIVSTDVPGIQEGKHIAYCKNVIERMKIHLFNRMIISEVASRYTRKTGRDAVNGVRAKPCSSWSRVRPQSAQGCGFSAFHHLNYLTFHLQLPADSHLESPCPSSRTRATVSDHLWTSFLRKNVLSSCSY